MYRLNTYPLIHLGFLHALLNTLALAPLLERFEADHGTLLTAAMFVGRTHRPELPNKLSSINQLSLALSTLPAAAYLLVERGLLRGNTAVMGARCEQRLSRGLKRLSKMLLTRSTVSGFSYFSAQRVSKLSGQIRTLRAPNHILLYACFG